MNPAAVKIMKISVFKIGKYGVPKCSQYTNRVWRKLNISVSLWKKEHSHLNLVLDHALRKKKKELTQRPVVNICLLKYISPGNWSGMLVHLRKLFSGLILFFFFLCAELLPVSLQVNMKIPPKRKKLGNPASGLSQTKKTPHTTCLRKTEVSFPSP